MSKSKLWVAVDKILWEDWDPIGVNDYGGSKDEYQGYISSIIKLLERDADTLKITELLHNHAKVNMGLNSTLERHVVIAEKLKQII
jgi:hypothetical protein